VRSSVPGAGYEFFSGTSMAGPHVAGLVALLLDARPDLAGRVDEIEMLLRLSAIPLTSTQTCGAFPGSQVPNAVFGHGRIDALEAVVGDPDGDGIGTLSDCAPADMRTWATPGPASDLKLAVNSLTTALGWTAPLEPGGETVHYDVLRSAEPDDFSSPICLASDATALQTFDAGVVTDVAYYLVRVENDCGAAMGFASDGTPRTGGACP
jgi:hypothetical protein